LDFTVTVDIAAPPPAVWVVIRDVERWHEWTASITSITRLDAGPLEVGSRATVQQPKLPTNTFTVTRLEEGRGFDWESRSPALTGIGHHWIEPTATGSRVTLGVDFRGLLAPIVRLFYGGLTQRYIEMEAAGLERRVEGGASGGRAG
jgi:carbon monoxide dehydrogenase subunit G